MPQAIALQPLMTTAAKPAAAAALAGGGSVTGKAPLFAGLVFQLGHMALPSALSAGEPAVARETSSPAHAGQPSAQPKPPALSAVEPAVARGTGSPANAGQPSAQPEPAALPAGEPAVARKIGSSGDAGQQSTPTKPLGTRLPDQTQPTPEPALPAVPPSLPAPLPGSMDHQRTTVEAHPQPPREPAANPPSTNGSDIIASVALTPAPIPVLPPPPTAPEPPRRTSAEGPRPEGVALKSGTTASEPPGNETASASTAPTATTPSMEASPAWQSAPAAAAATAAGASPAQSVLATTQPEQNAGPVQLPDPVAAASTPQPDATPAAPAQQVSAALVSLAHAPDGGQRMTLRLEPAELGLVQIRIDRPSDAPAQVDITVQRPETLTLLLRDQPQLQRALDQAGVPADGRGLTLHVEAPDSATPSGNPHSSTAIGADPGQSGGNGAGTGSGGQGRPGDATEQDQDDPSTPLPRWLRAGLDITA